MPTRRPRLVQEGKPLYGDDHEDHSMTESAESSSATLTHQPANATPRPSSLAMAARGSIPIRPSHHIPTKIVVGDASLAHHDDDSAIDAMACSPPRHKHSPPHKKKSPLQMRLVIGEGPQNLHHEAHQAPSSHIAYAQRQHDASSYETVERMEGVEHLGPKGPLVVMDGANIAYAYADALSGFAGRGMTEPDARGIHVAAEYFLSMNVRVLVVIPASWFRAKPRAGDESQGNALMETPQLEVLNDLKARGLLVAAPPRDDDDAYALTIARREDTRSHQRGGCGGFVLSCDMFRDAISRDVTGELSGWLTKGSGHGPGRISFAFCDMGSTDDYGDREMDFVPNPRHPLIAWIEGEHRKASQINSY